MKSSKVFLSALAGLLLFLTGCLQTRSEVKESDKEKALRDQVIQFQKSAADSDTRVIELETQMRQMLGRLDVLEHDMGLNKEEKEKKDSEAHEKLNLTQQALAQMEEDIKKLKIQWAEVQGQLEELKSTSANKKSKTKKEKEAPTKGDFEEAQELFKDGAWKNAILKYQKYKEANPKGKKLDEATYKIALCFQELKMSEEATTFFNEVIRNFPNSSFAKKAKQKLK